MVLPPDLITAHYFWLLADRWLQFTFMWVKNPELLWLLIPVWLNWLLTEYFQERKGTSYGNAISNGFVMFWVGLDSARTIVNEYAKKGLAISLTHIVMVGIILAYGSLIMFEAIKGKKIAHLIGRIREVTYFTTASIGIIYNAIIVDIHSIIALLVFFPVFYIGMEIFLRLLPAPKEELIEEGEGEKEEKSKPQVKQQIPTIYQQLMKRRLLFKKK